jgi:uncharacterized protein
MDYEINLELEAGRFSAVVDGETCVLEFSGAGDVVAMNSVRVPKAVGGRGIAGQLTRHALDWARSEGLKVQPNCPYVKNWIDRHPEYQDLIPAP